DSVTGLGRQLNEEGGLHRPPFSFPSQMNPLRICLVESLQTSATTWKLSTQKMSGRWGDRPLGRGGWRVIVIRSWLGTAGRSAALASSRATQEQTCLTPETEPLPTTVPVCVSPPLASIGRAFHSERYYSGQQKYFALVQKYLLPGEEIPAGSVSDYSCSATCL